MQDEEIINEGFWYSKQQPHLPKPVAGEPFKEQAVILNLMFLFEDHLEKLYREHASNYNDAWRRWHATATREQKQTRVGEPQYEEGTAECPVTAYRGSSACRICGKMNGSHEYVFGGYRWPSGYRHYIEEHNVEPSEGFKKMLGAAAMWMAHPPIRYQIEEGVDGNVVGVQRMVAADNIVLLHVNTRCKRPKVTALGSDTIDDKDVPIIYIDTLDGADGDDTGIVLLEYAGWTVWSAQAVKYGVNVSLHSPDALFPKQEEDPDEA